MRSVATFALISGLGLASACTAVQPTAARNPSPAAAVSATPHATPSPDVSPAASEPPPPTPPAPRVGCVAALIPASEALIGGSNGEFLYDVGDPVHPRAVCRIENTSAHILTGTTFEYLVPRRDGTADVILNALGSNNESVAATLRADLTSTAARWVGPVAWTPDLSRLAYMADGGSDASGFSVTDVWLATATSRTRIFRYSVPGKDSFGRPGFAPPTLGFSADGQYLAAGWTVSTSPIQVFRVADAASVSPAMPADARFAIWAKTGATLYIVGTASVSRWTPRSAVQAMDGVGWTLDPSLSPDGSQVAFTVVTSTHQVRTYVHDVSAKTDRLLVDQPRSSAVFVKTGWLWQMEERTCVPDNNHSCFDPTEPDSTVLAYDLATGHESRVVFAAGESPSTYSLAPGDMWPNA